MNTSIKIQNPEMDKLPHFKTIIYQVQRPCNNYDDFVQFLDVSLKTKNDIIKKTNKLIRGSEDLTFITQDWIKQEVHNFGVDNLMFSRMLDSAMNYVKNSKKIIFQGEYVFNRSFQLSSNDFFIKELNKKEIEQKFKDYVPNRCYKVQSSQIKPFYIFNLSKNFIQNIKHMIIRPKLYHKNINPFKWEVKLIPEYKGYIIDNIDR